MSKGSSSSGANKMTESKLAEAEQQLKEADKLASKTLTRWKPDWEGAAVLYEKAATNFKNAKSYERAKETFKKASNAQYQIDLPFTAAKMMESAAAMCKELKQSEEGALLYEKASKLYRENGSGFNAADNLAKAAKLIEPANVEKAMQFLKEACEVFELEDKEHYSGDTFKTAISLFLKNEKYVDCVELMKNQLRVLTKLNQPHDLHKSYLSIIVIYLYCDDFVAANNHYNQYCEENPQFMQSSEGMAAGELLDACEKRNPDALKAVTNKQLFNFLDNQVTKIARKIVISDALVPEHPMGTSSAPSGSGPSAPAQEEIDDDNLL